MPAGLDVTLITQDVLNAARAGDGDPFDGDLPALEVIEPYKALMPEVRTARVSGPWDPADAGSNNWVMSGSRTPSGIPILANDPHRRIEMPALRYFTHLVAPGWNVLGGERAAIRGRQRRAQRAHGVGTSRSRERTWLTSTWRSSTRTNPNMVRWQDGWEPLRVIREEIRVKGEAPRSVELKFSRHGPVFYVDAANRRAYAVTVRRPGTGNGRVSR